MELLKSETMNILGSGSICALLFSGINNKLVLIEYWVAPETRATWASIH